MAAVMANGANKRKRDVSDVPNLRSAPGIAPESDFTQQYINDDATDNGIDFSAVIAQNHEVANVQRPQTLLRPGQSASDTATAALAQYHTMTVPQPTEQAFLNQAVENGETQSESTNDRRTSNFVSDVDFTTRQAEGESPPSDLPVQNLSGRKPAVGSDEWHKVRRDNHKEVERRRRETINEGINELQKIVPGCEKNKGSILARAVQFITQLKINETQNIEKWTLEKMLSEQAIAELSSTCDKLKTEVRRAWAECELWKKAAQKAGIHVDVDTKLDIETDDD